MTLADLGSKDKGKAMSELGAAALAAMKAMVGERGVEEDAAIMAAQLQRAVRILSAPEMGDASLFALEPSSHAAALLRLAPQDQR